MRKLVALVTLSTLAALGAVATVAGTASALEPTSGIEQATVERQDMQVVSREGDDGLLMNTSTYEQTTEPQALDVLVESASREVADKLGALAEKSSSVSVHEMLEMAMLMNHFSQVSDMASSVIGAANAAISDMSRNIKS